MQPVENHITDRAPGSRAPSARGAASGTSSGAGSGTASGTNGHRRSDANPVATLSAVILAGSLRPPPLREAMNVHVLCLPMGRAGTLLDCWLGLMKSVPGLKSVRVVVTTEEDAISVRSALPREYRNQESGIRRQGSGVRGQESGIRDQGSAPLSPDSCLLTPDVEVMAETRAWRGAGGIVRDVTEGLPDDALILVCEGTRLPPPSLDPLLLAMAHQVSRIRGQESGDIRPTSDSCLTPDLAGVVGVCGEDTPAGVYVFRRSAFDLVPRIGYSDMKEQVLPALSKAGRRVTVARLSDDLWPHEQCGSDLEAYLAAVRSSLSAGVRDQESGVRDQESGVRDQGSGVRGQESGVRDQESGVRDQGSGVRDQGSAPLSPDSCLLPPDSCLLSPDSCLLSPDSCLLTPALLRVSSRASVSASAVLDGFCIVEPGAVIEDGAVVHDSVVLWGATIGGGAVVSRSVVAPLANVEPRARAVRTIVARNAGNRH